MFNNREFCIAWDPARSSVGDWSALCLLRLEGFSEQGQPLVRAMGWSRSRGVHSENQIQLLNRMARNVIAEGAAGVSIVIDTGGDRSLLDLTRSASPTLSSALGVQIHGGEKGSFDAPNRILRAPKQDLVLGLDKALTAETPRLMYSQDAPLVEQFLGEVGDLRGHVLPSGRMQVGAAPGRHDDLVMATAIGYYAVSSGDNALWTPQTVAFWGSIANPVFPDIAAADAFAPSLMRAEQPAPAALRFRWG